jgi:hypothetical protein
MATIQNYKELIGHGDMRPRRVVLDCLQTALAAADTYEGTPPIVRIEGDLLHLGEQRFDLSMERRHGFKVNLLVVLKRGREKVSRTSSMASDPSRE